ncbi:MAG TPA: serine/threonine-protein kinase, partial [Thermomicrobiales bacterium]|nr:serine/threonine-protein kinase [Thermomicrobiales bacterium]
MSTEPNLVGQIISSYRIEALLGSGGMGQVYRGTHVHLRRSVAIKIMHAELAGDPMFQERFLREARAAASLSHANIVHVYDFGVQDGRAFLVMELVTDGSLATLQQAGPLDLLVGLDLVRQAAWGLAFAHERGVVHRDIKPDNLLLAPRTPPAPELAPHTLKIADFGLVRLLDGSPLTQSGMSMGTPAYMSPEQCQGQDIDQRSDVYSLGVILYEVATAARPFNVRNLTDATYQHVHVAPPPARQIAPDLSPDIEQLIDRCLAKQPRDRFQQARTLAASIDAVITMETGRRRSGSRPNIAAAAVPIAAAAVSLGLAPSGPDAAGLPIGPGAGGVPGGPSGGLGGGPNVGGIASGP